MKTTKTAKVSVIIPCYNEEKLIGYCLSALNSQSIKPYEIIVVDNNSTDKTARIARRLGAKVVTEPAQGIIAARNKGFAEASGDILAKLDADSLPSEDWIKEISTIFENPKVKAATGTGYFYDAPSKWFVRAYRNLFAVWLNRVVLGHHMLWGSNLAIRSEAWQAVEADCCSMRDIMEDLDLAIHINAAYGARAIVYRPKMRADISGRRAMVSLKRNYLYLRMWPKTLSLHGYEGRILLWPAIAILLITMAIANKYARFYNPQQSRMIFSRNQWQSNPFYSRDNP